MNRTEQQSKKTVQTETNSHICITISCLAFVHWEKSLKMYRWILVHGEKMSSEQTAEGKAGPFT